MSGRAWWLVGLGLCGCLGEGEPPVTITVSSEVEQTRTIDSLTPDEHTRLCHAIGAARVALESTDAHCRGVAFMNTVVEGGSAMWEDADARRACEGSYRACKDTPVPRAGDGCAVEPGPWVCRMTVGQAETCAALVARHRNQLDRALPICRDVTIEILADHHSRPEPPLPTELLPCKALPLTTCPPYLLFLGS